MYTDFFGLKDKPFSIIPDAKFLYLGKGQRECSSQILSSLKENVGLVVLTGRLGTGKTTLCRAVLSQLSPNYKVANMFDPHLEGVDFLKRINKELGIPYQHGDKKSLLDELRGHLLDRRKAGGHVVLVVEEAQNLSHDAVELITALSSEASGGGRLIQIILVGQHEFDFLLENEPLRQLRQMVAVWCRLAPLTQAETAEYVGYRMSVVGGGHLEIFPEKVIAEIHKYSKGVPRLINLLCDRALHAAYAEDKRKLDVGMIRGCIRAVSGRAAGANMIPRLAPALLVVAFMAVLWMSISSGAIESSVVTEARMLASIMKTNGQAQRAVEPAALSVPAPATVAPAPTDHFFDENGLTTAVNAVLAKWGVSEAVGAGESAQTVQEIAEKKGFKLFEGRIDQETLLKLNYPAILVLDSGNGKKGFLPVVGISDEKYLTGAQTAEVDRNWAKKNWSGEAYIFWKDFSGSSGFLKKGDRGKQVRWLQSGMRKLGYLDGARNVSGVYGKLTEKAVQNFQEKNLLQADGRADDVTKMIMLGLLGEYKIPRLS